MLINSYKAGDKYVYTGNQYDIITQVFKVKSIQNKEKSIAVELLNSNGEVLYCNFWKNDNNPNIYVNENGEYDLVEIHQGDVAEFTGFEYSYNNYKQFNAIGGYRLVEYEPTMFKEAIRVDTFYNIIKTYIGHINNTALHDTCIEALNDIKDTLSVMPAAHKHHHNYNGGLIQHTAEVMTNAFAIADAYICKRDIIIASAFFHDLLKVKEYDNLGNYTEYGNMIGHVVGSALLFKQYAEAHNVDEVTIEAVMHCILSHHGKKEWGSPVEPKTVEAVIVHEADMVSSYVNPIYLQSKEINTKDYYNNI